MNRNEALACAVGAVLWHGHIAGAAQPDEVEEVVVTATALRETGLEVAQPTAVLDGDVLRRQTAASIGETLATLPGVTGSYFGPAASRPVIRGFAGERVQVLEDSIGSLDASGLSPDHAVTVESVLARQIEVIKGPATLLYGNGSVGGVVNVLSDRIPAAKPDKPVNGAVEARGDSAIEEKAAAGRFDGSLGSLTFHADAYTRETDDVEIRGAAWSDELRAARAAAGEPVDETRGVVRNSGSESDGGAVGLTWFGASGSIGFAASLFDTHYGVPGPEEEEEEPAPATLEPPLARSFAPEGVSIEMEQQRYDLRARLERQAARLSAIRFLASFVDYEHQELEPDGAVGTRFDQQAFEGRLAFEHGAAAGWRGTFGAQYRDIDLTAIGAEAFLPPTVTRNAGAFVFEERAFGPVTVELGARFENQKIEVDAGASPAYSDSTLNYSAGAVWKFTERYSTALNLTWTERHPTATELYADGPHIALRRFEVGDAGLDRERALTADLTLRKYSGSVRFSLTAYASDFQRYIFPAPAGTVQDGLPVVQYVQADAEFQGFEGEVTLPIAQGAYGRFDARFAADYVRGKLSRGGDLPQVPPLRAGGELRFERGGWQAGLGAWVYDEQDKVAANELTTDGYTLLDADVGYRMEVGEGQLYAFVRGSNLLDEEARRHASSLKDFAPLPGQSVAAGVRMEF